MANPQGDEMSQNSNDDPIGYVTGRLLLVDGGLSATF